MIRTLLSPGVELNEVDKSQYNATTIDTYKVLLPGFASKGKLSLPTTITSLTQFKNDYGTPTNEAERYAYNATNIILNGGGEVIFARLPYAESANYPCTTYTVGDAVAVSGELSVLSATDPSITSANTITMSDTAMLDVSQYIDLASSQGIGTNDIKIVDITRSEYATYTSEGSKINCLGILPVITTAANALAIASQLTGVNMYNITDTTIDAINAFESLSAVQYITANDPLTFANTSNNWLVPVNSIVGANTQQSISKNAAEFFPTISYFAGSDQTDIDTTVYDKSYFSYIGVVVYKLEVDSATGCLQATPVEAFAGSVIKDAVDIRTNASTYIENVVNNTSKYIKLYANVSDNTIQDSILYVEPTLGTILGNAPIANTAKTIKFADITSNLDDILNSQSNILTNTIDVVCDAGVSTIGQFVTYSSDLSATIPTDGDAAAFDPDSNTISAVNVDTTAAWRAIVDKIKGFCQNTRKDCVFITESPRHFSIKGRNKIVDGTNASITVGKNITPNIRYISGINSSYGWGYAVWFKIADAHSGKMFWMPPSAFGVAAYVNTRRNTSVWAAPAGITRGAISVADTSFEPDLQARNALYSNAWNYSLTYVNQGTVLEGQKTFQIKTSAFDRINVRSTFLYLERRVFNIARNYIYEPNTAYTRQQFVDAVTPMFANMQAAGGIYDYKIIADSTINTPEIIDANEFRIKIGIKPTRTIEFIMIEFVALRTGSTFTELV